MTITQEQELAYSQRVADLVKPGATIALELNGHTAHAIHMVLGIAGEAGELVDAVKKYAIYRKEIDIENVIEELGDLEFYMEGLRQGFGITREETIKANTAKLSVRYKDHEYSDQSATARADKG